MFIQHRPQLKVREKLQQGGPFTLSARLEQTKQSEHDLGGGQSSG